MGSILLIEDDPVIAEEVADALVMHDHAVTRAGDGRAGLQLALARDFDLVLLDVMLPGIDGYDVCQKIREKKPGLPVIMLTARGQEGDKLLGFELDADDYLAKPFSLKELLARIKALLRRRGPGAVGAVPDRITLGASIIDFAAYTVERQGQTFNLSPKERRILQLLAGRAGQVVSRDHILDRVWGDEYDPIPRTVDNFILKLRQKIETDPENPRHLVTVHGAGYKLVL